MAEFELIEETYNSVNSLATSFPVFEFLSTSSSLLGFFKFQTVFDNILFLTASDLTLGLMRVELVFSLFNWLSESNEVYDRYSIIF